MVTKLDKYKRIIIIVVLMIMCANAVINPLPAKALNYSGDIGTNAALGSPLLNETNWDNNDWNQWEMVTFGVFLSNFCQPFVDSYMTAFQEGKGGTDGHGLKALQFGSGSDFNADGILQSMLTYALKFQTQSMKELKVDFVKVNDGTKSDTRTAKRAATINDLYVYTFDHHFDDLHDWGGDHKTDDSPYIDDVESKTLDSFFKHVTWDPLFIKQNFELNYARTMNLPTFYIGTSGSAGDQVVFDLTDGYDIQMMALSINSAMFSKYQKQAIDNFQDLMKNNAKLYMDIFGNIVAKNKSGQFVIIIPASTNQHLTKEKSYNLLTSFMMLENYVPLQGDNLADSLYGLETSGLGYFNAKRSLGSRAIPSGGRDGELDGESILYFDSDYAIFKRIKDKMKGGMSLDDAITATVDDGMAELQWGSVLTTLIDSKMTTDHSNYPFETEVIGVSPEKGKGWFTKISYKLFGGAFLSLDGFGRRCLDALTSAQYVTNWFPTDTNAKLLNYMYTIDGKKLQLFNKKVYVSPTTGVGSYRRYINYAMSYADPSNKIDLSGVAGGSILGQNDFYNQLKSKKRVTSIGSFIFNKEEGETVTGDAKASGLYDHFIKNESGLKLNKASKKPEATFNNLNESIKDRARKLMYTYTSGTLVSEANGAVMRVIAAFSQHSGMKTAADIFSAADGMQYASYTPWIYLTYLDFYGLTNKEGQSNFNPAIFEDSDILKTNASDLFEGVTLNEEDKKAQITDFTWRLLSPKEGRSYRNQLIEGTLNEFMYRNYKKACYGDSGVSTINSSISSSVSDGFLRLSSLSENKFTSYFIMTYASNAMILMLLVLLLSIVGGIVKGKSLGYFFASFLLTISVLLLSPNIGDIAPYICNKIVQNMFNDNMRYWAISESIENSQIEKEYGSSPDDEESSVPMLIRMMDINYLDRTIMMKGDISKKVVEAQAIDFNQLQKLKSARWLIPSLMRQFSSADSGADYVYTPLGDLYRNMSISYWFYSENPKVSLDKQNNSTYSKNNYKEPVVTYTSGGDKTEFTLLSEDGKRSIYGGYKNTKNTSGSQDYHSLTRLNSDSQNSHTQLYMLNFGNKLKIMSPLDYSDIDTTDGLTTKVWDEYADKVADGTVKSSADSLKNVADTYMWSRLNSYNSYQKGMPSFFNYLWMTENPAMYFYHLVKDTFEPTYGVAAIALELQGYYDKIDTNGDGEPDGDDVRHSFMHDVSNGQVRDFLDMEELFTNVLPYLYNVQILAGGTNGENGAFGSELLGDEYSVYSENTKAWMFRSNWVTKMEESKIYNGKDTIGYMDSDGNHQKAEIVGGLHPSNYEKYRPMVFSKAQMVSLGLTNADLSLAENKIIKVNDAVMLDWTLLTNYANTGGMTAEVLYRQMAVDAMLAFNKEFSPDNGINPSMALHPTTLDLRSISFDSVMKLLMVSSTTNSQDIYGDTMKSVISGSSTLSGMVLLIDAELCNAIIPNARDLAMALVFYLMLWNLAMAIIKQDRSKGKVVVGTLLINLRYALYTVAYYAVFYLMITMSTPDEIISKSKMSITSSVPTFKFVVVLVASALYIYFIVWKIAVFTWKNRHDMGFDAQMTMLSNVADKIGKGFNKLTGAVHSSAGSTNATIKESKNKIQTEVKNSKAEPVKSEIVDGTVEIGPNYKSNSDEYKIRDSGYASELKDKGESLDASSINREIKKGEAAKELKDTKDV